MRTEFILVIFQKPEWPETTTTWIYLGGACVTASIATFSSNAAIQYINPGLASVAQNTDLIGKPSPFLTVLRKIFITKILSFGGF